MFASDNGGQIAHFLMGLLKSKSLITQPACFFVSLVQSRVLAITGILFLTVLYLASPIRKYRDRIGKPKVTEVWGE